MGNSYMQVTEEDGGRLNAFAKEPRMQVMEAGEGNSRASLALIVGGSVLVLVMLAMAVGIS
jgi:hypothetical protein